MSLKPFIIKVGKKYMGRLLAHDEENAKTRAAGFWGRGKKYTAAQVIKQTATVVATNADTGLNIGDELDVETTINFERQRVETRIVGKRKKR